MPIFTRSVIGRETRLHSSRMRTGRSLTVCCSLLPGVVSLVPGGFSLVRGGVLLGPEGGFSLVPGGFSLVLGGGLPGPGGGSPETPPMDRITDTCKNITLATTSLRPVKILITVVLFQDGSLTWIVSNTFTGCCSHCCFLLHFTHLEPGQPVQRREYRK